MRRKELKDTELEKELKDTELDMLNRGLQQLEEHSGGSRVPGCYAGGAGVGFFLYVCAQIHLAGRQGERAVACRCRQAR